jgi:phosphohistidine phosphatase
VANYVGKLNLAVSQIFHSGKTRSLRSAEFLAASLKPPKGVAVTDGLAPLDNPETWAGRLSQMAEDLLLVGHLPHLAMLTALLICGDKGRSVVHFQMGGMLCLKRLEAGCWAVEWMIIPKMIV